mmetsp:Transcript_39376/g.130354  ORF Transcript_39376/g.130354 Transcript_39376/m.130354 type:complete len:425 (+) Transcript_39376:51-1325(+)
MQLATVYQLHSNSMVFMFISCPPLYRVHGGGSETESGSLTRPAACPLAPPPPRARGASTRARVKEGGRHSAAPAASLPVERAVRRSVLRQHGLPGGQGVEGLPLKGEQLAPLHLNVGRAPEGPLRPAGHALGHPAGEHVDHVRRARGRHSDGGAEHGAPVRLRLALDARRGGGEADAHRARRRAVRAALAAERHLAERRLACKPRGGREEDAERDLRLERGGRVGDVRDGRARVRADQVGVGRAHGPGERASGLEVRLGRLGHRLELREVVRSSDGRAVHGDVDLLQRRPRHLHEALEGADDGLRPLLAGRLVRRGEQVAQHRHRVVRHLLQRLTLAREDAVEGGEHVRRRSRRLAACHRVDERVQLGGEHDRAQVGRRGEGLVNRRRGRVEEAAVDARQPGGRGAVLHAGGDGGGVADSLAGD